MYLEGAFLIASAVAMACLALTAYVVFIGAVVLAAFSPMLLAIWFITK